MTDVDIAFNDEFFDFSTVPDPLVAATDSTRAKDLEDVATHEVGHFGGLADIYNPGYVGWDVRMGDHNEGLTMHGIIRNDETFKRSLAQGDINGVNHIYSHVPKSAIDLVLLFDGSSTFASKYNGFAPSKTSAEELIFKLRANGRVAVVKLPDSVLVYPTAINDDADA